MVCFSKLSIMCFMKIISQSTLFIIIWLFLFSNNVYTALPEGKPGVEYYIEAEFRPDENLVRGMERVVWRNGTDSPAAELKMHLYMNAWRSNDSLFLRQAQFEGILDARGAGSFGGTDILSVRLNNGADIVDKISIYETVMTVPLEKPVKPGEAVTLTIEFETHLPAEAMRAGRAGNYYLFQGWYPKFGVFEGCAWNCRQFHPYTEFYADFADYDVRLSAPAHFVLGGTGVKERRLIGDGASAEWRFRARWVTDFAWAASPDFITIKDQHKGVEIELLLQPFHKGAKEKYLKALKASMTRLGGMLGDYPYPKITLVDPYPGTGTDSMEYPMFITGGTTFFEYAARKGMLSPEAVTAHEFAHQYFYGMLASDEAADPWLDEGFTTYAETLIMDETGQRYRFDSLLSRLARPLDFYTFTPSDISDNFLGYLDGLAAGASYPAVSWRRISYVMGERRDPIVSDGTRVFNYPAYGANAYSYPLLILRTLGNVYGPHRLHKALGDYVREWSFRHPKTEDAIRSISKSIGGDSELFLRRLLFTTGGVDYAVTDINSSPEPKPSEDVTGNPEAKKSSGGTARPLFRSVVSVERKGEIVLPVEIEIFFENGKPWRYKWDMMNRTPSAAVMFGGWDDFANMNGRRVMLHEGTDGKWLKIYFLDPAWVIKGQVDPGYKLEVDRNMLNNSYSAEPDRRLQRGLIAKCFNLLYKSFLTLSFLN
jgi:hypothetical protein